MQLLLHTVDGKQQAVVLVLQDVQCVRVVMMVTMPGAC